MTDILGALLIPTERPPSSIDIKRALLTFDQVHIPSPADREFVDPSRFTPLVRPEFAMMAPFLSVAGPPVLPLGKTPGYDDAFQELADDLKEAVADGFVVFVDAPPITENAWTFGAPPPPPPTWPDAAYAVGNLIRFLEQPSVFLEAARGIGDEETLRSMDIDALAPAGEFFALLKQVGVELPPDASLPPDIDASVKRLAAARIGSVIKSLGISEIRGLFPLASTDATADLLQLIHAQAGECLAKVIAGQGDEEEDVRRAMRAERVVFEEVGSERALATMSVADVLKLRTGTNWDRAARARRKFLDAVRRLSNEADNDSDFDRAVVESIRSYASAADDSRHELKKLGLAVVTPSLKNLLAGGGLGGLAAGLVGLPSWELAIPFAAMFHVLSEVRDQMLDNYRLQRQQTKSVGKALVDVLPKSLRRKKP